MKVKKRMNIEKYPIYFNLFIIKTGSKIKRITAEYACWYPHSAFLKVLHASWSV